MATSKATGLVEAGGVFKREISVTSETDNILLKIPLKPLGQHFRCTICLSSMHEASLTSCGHRYCYKCIEESVSRNHKCPICNAMLTIDDVIKDKEFDALIETVIEEKVKAEKEYYQSTAKAVSEAAFSNDKSRGSVVTPLQTVLQEHLKHTLEVHEAYRQQVVDDCLSSRARAQHDKQRKVDQVLCRFPHNPDHPERIAQLKKIEEEFEVKTQLLQDELARIENLLTTAFDKYLTDFLPSPATIPIAVKISVPEKDFVAENVIIKPSDCMDVILGKVKKLLEEQGKEVVEFPPCVELEISLLSPFTGEADLEEEERENGPGKIKMKTKPTSLAAGDSQQEDRGPSSLLHTTLHGDCCPVMLYRMKPGSEIRIRGNILLKGERPPVCFAANYSKDKDLAVDYFTCRTCGNINWICRQCSEVCHKGHDTILQVPNHKPKWACCYCSKKSKPGNHCKLQPPK